jgi:hypothetical protein
MAVLHLEQGAGPGSPQALVASGVQRALVPTLAAMVTSAGFSWPALGTAAPTPCVATAGGPATIGLVGLCSHALRGGPLVQGALLAPVAVSALPPALAALLQDAHSGLRALCAPLGDAGPGPLPEAMDATSALHLSLHAAAGACG